MQSAILYVNSIHSDCQGLLIVLDSQKFNVAFLPNFGGNSADLSDPLSKTNTLISNEHRWCSITWCAQSHHRSPLKKHLVMSSAKPFGGVEPPNSVLCVEPKTALATRARSPVLAEVPCTCSIVEEGTQELQNGALRELRDPGVIGVLPVRLWPCFPISGVHPFQSSGAYATSATVSELEVPSICF